MWRDNEILTKGFFWKKRYKMRRTSSGNNFKHGYSNTRTYHIWYAMKRRCFQIDSDRYIFHGARGITVCANWRTSFVNFLRDMGECPPDLTIERKDNSSNYSCGHCEECVEKNWPANCYWATMKEQANNRRSNRMITFNKQSQTLQQWADGLGINASTLDERIKNWSLERALTEPCHPPGRARAIVCKYGHVLSGDNVKVYDGHQHCQECRRARDRKRKSITRENCFEDL